MRQQCAAAVWRHAIHPPSGGDTGVVVASLRTIFEDTVFYILGALGLNRRTWPGLCAIICAVLWKRLATCKTSNWMSISARLPSTLDAPSVGLLQLRRRRRRHGILEPRQLGVQPQRHVHQRQQHRHLCKHTCTFILGSIAASAWECSHSPRTPAPRRCMPVAVECLGFQGVFVSICRHRSGLPQSGGR